MKKIILLILLAVTSIEMKSQILLDTVTYDSTQDEYLMYNNTFSNLGSYARIDFNLPFAEHFYINGTHVEFTINKEMVLRHLFRDPNQKYYDIRVNIYDGTHLGWPDEGPILPVSTTGIIRIYIKR